jgi:polysaccharide chain length determinant protein (PEP-CTERM system associated)
VNNVVERSVDGIKRTGRLVLRRRWWVLTTSAVVATLSALAISFVHDRYQATARVYVDTQTVLKPLMQNLTFQPDIEQEVSMLARTLISRPNVERLVAIPQLGLASGGIAAHERIVTKLMGDIQIVPVGSGNLYDISYRGTSPEQAQRLVEATVNLFVDSGAGAKKRDSQEAGRFIDEQIKAYEAKLTESENRLKDFKVGHFGLTGVSNQDYFSRVSALTEEVSKLRVDLAGAEQSRDSYRRELASEDPQLPPGFSGTLPPGADIGIDGRIAEQRKALDDLLRRYTDEHPDVVNARRVLVQLQAESQRMKEEDQALVRSGLAGSGTRRRRPSTGSRGRARPAQSRL